jgi:hypothetical protein
MQPPGEEFRWLGPGAIVRRPCGCVAYFGADDLPELNAVVPYGGTDEAHVLLDMGAHPNEQIFTLCHDNVPQFWRQARSVFLSKELAQKINVIAAGFKPKETERWKLILQQIREKLINAGLGQCALDYMDPAK